MSKIKKLPLPEFPNHLSKLPDHLVYVGSGNFEWMKEVKMGDAPFFGYSKASKGWIIPLGYYCDGFHRALPRNSPLLEKYFILPETPKNVLTSQINDHSKFSEQSGKNLLTSAEKTTTMTTMKAKITLKEFTNIQCPDGYTAFQITEQENVPLEKSFTASNLIEVTSVGIPEFVSETTLLTTWSNCLYLRGSNKEEDDRIIVVRHEDYPKIRAAVAEYLEFLNNPKRLYVGTFFYKNEKNGAKKRRLVEVQKEDGDYIEGIDKDIADGTPFRRFLKKNIIGEITKVG